MNTVVTSVAKGEYGGGVCVCEGGVYVYVRKYT